MLRKIKNSTLYLKLRDTFLGRKYLIKKKKVLTYQEINEYQNQAHPVLLDLEIAEKEKPCIGIVKSGTYFDDYVNPNSSWLFYERYLKNNNIPYVFYDIYKSDWLTKAREIDIVMWHPDSTPEAMYLAENRIYVLEQEVGKTCFPSYHELWQYEDKNRSYLLYDVLTLPCPPTFASHSKEEALFYLDKVKFPIISKVHIGAGSSGVELFRNKRQAIRYVNKVFGYSGKRTKYPYLRQKDYVYFQEFIEDATFDLRIIIISNKVFGYYRYPNKNDFRASGSGKYEKKELPLEAVKLAIDIKNKLGSRLMGVDLMYSLSRKQYFIIETSLFNQIDSPEQLLVDGVAGYYDINDKLKFKEGKYWIHELVMDAVLKEYLNKKNDTITL